MVFFTPVIVMIDTHICNTFYLIIKSAIALRKSPHPIKNTVRLMFCFYFCLIIAICRWCRKHLSELWNELEMERSTTIGRAQSRDESPEVLRLSRQKC